MPDRDVAHQIRSLAEEKILVLDGAWGVLLQNRGLTEADFRGERFAEHPRDLLNDPDLLNLTRPDIVRSVHDAYFAAGADITTTNTFTATSIGQADYGSKTPCTS
jgi:5-methyltetrahydrofolate--homocysteine methyltransferase